MHPAWGSLSDDEQHACVQDYLINHSSQHVLQARSVNGINLQWIRIPFIKDGIYDNMRKRVPQDTIEHIYSQVGVGILFVVTTTCYSILKPLLLNTQMPMQSLQPVESDTEMHQKQ
jgi:hypothetical protein